MMILTAWRLVIAIRGCELDRFVLRGRLPAQHRLGGGVFVGGVACACAREDAMGGVVVAWR